MEELISKLLSSYYLLSKQIIVSIDDMDRFEEK